MDALSGSATSTERLRTRVREVWLGLLALTALLLGTFIYVAERPAKVYFLPVAYDPHIHTAVLHAVSGQLPSFVHVYAFILLSFAVAPRSMRLGSICLSWVVIDSLFEVAQHPGISRRLLGTLPSLFEHVPVIESVPTFLRFGTFDPFDLLAIGLGACAAWATCRHSRDAEVT